MGTQAKPEDLHKIAIEAYKLIQSKVTAQNYIPEVVNILQDRVRTIRNLIPLNQRF